MFLFHLLPNIWNRKIWLAGLAGPTPVKNLDSETVARPALPPLQVAKAPGSADRGLPAFLKSSGRQGNSGRVRHRSRSHSEQGTKVAGFGHNNAAGERNTTMHKCSAKSTSKSMAYPPLRLTLATCLMPCAKES